MGQKKTLSKGGKEILLKTVAQSLPNYAMGVFLLPIDLCQHLERLMCRFWWRTDPKKEKSIHWQSWHNLCRRKSNGGMGFRSVRDFNLALLGNQGWRLLKHPDKLVSRIFKARYYPNGTFLNATIGSNPSYVWRSVLESQQIIKAGVGCRAGNGSSINILTDPWLPSVSQAYVQSDNMALVDQKVSSLMSMDSNSWDLDILYDLFNVDEISTILSIPLDKNVDDSWYWRHEKLGFYSVKSAYLQLQDHRGNNSTASNSGFWRKLWNLKIPPKIKNFLWRASSNCLPEKV